MKTSAAGKESAAGWRPWSAIGLTALVAILMTHASDAQAPLSGNGRIVVAGYVRVIDGDTLEVQIDGMRVGVGLLGIRAPMGNTPCGLQATEALAALVEGGVVLEEDPDYGFDGRYRRMYYGQTRKDMSIALSLAEAGLVQGDGRGAETPEIAAAVARARASGTGCQWRRGR